MRQELGDLKVVIYEDGEIDRKEVDLLKSLIKPETVKEEEARFLVDLNNVLSGQPRPAAFDEFYILVVSGYVFEGKDYLSNEKWEWLERQLLKDGVVDPLERSLLEEIDSRATSAPDGFRVLLEGGK